MPGSLLLTIACARPALRPLEATTTPPPPTCDVDLPNGDLTYDEQGSPSGIVVWAPDAGEEVVVAARIRIGDLEHGWEVGRVGEADGEIVLPLDIPPAGSLTSLQEFAMSDVYVALVRTRSDGEQVEQNIPVLNVVWTWGLDRAPVWYTNAQARTLWPGGIVGIVGAPGQGTWVPADAVEAWDARNR